MTIALGWWMIPLVITGVMLIWANESQKGGGYVGGVFEFFIGTIVSLIAWLVWALLT